MNTTKSHRIVLAQGAFNRIATLESGAAVESAENEGWPIQPDEQELPYAIANASVMALPHRHYVHGESDGYLWPGGVIGWQSGPMRVSTFPRKKLFAMVRQIGLARSASLGCL